MVSITHSGFVAIQHSFEVVLDKDDHHIGFLRSRQISLSEMRWNLFCCDMALYLVEALFVCWRIMKVKGEQIWWFVGCIGSCLLFASFYSRAFLHSLPFACNTWHSLSPQRKMHTRLTHTLSSSTISLTSKHTSKTYHILWCGHTKEVHLYLLVSCHILRY